MSGTVYVEGLAELQRAFAGYDKRLRKSLRDVLRDAAEPIRESAQSLASERISHIGPRWGLMRIGVTNTSVYLAPKSRRRGGSPRPNLGGLLMNDAMWPAVAGHEEALVGAVDIALDRFAAEQGF